MKIEVNPSVSQGQPFGAFQPGEVLIVTWVRDPDRTSVRVGDVAIRGAGNCAVLVPWFSGWSSADQLATEAYLFRPLRPGETVTFTGE